MGTNDKNTETKRENKKSVGVGDTIEKITKSTGIKAVVDKLSDILDFDCGCDERKEYLNKLFPYTKVECLTEEEYNFLKDYDFNSTVINNENKVKLISIYNRVLNKKQHMTNCVPCWKTILDGLQKVTNEYKK